MTEATKKEHTWANQNLNATDTVEAVKDGLETAKTKTKAVGEAISDSVAEFGDKVQEKEAEMNAPPSKIDEAKEKLGDIKDQIGSVFSGAKETEEKK